MNPDLRDRLRHLLERGTSLRSVVAAPGLAVGSILGPVRKDNQDRALVAHISRPRHTPDLVVAAVFDGMGGMIEGGEAAALAASTFLASLAGSKGPLDTRLSAAVFRANSEVFNRFKARGGTTLTAVAFEGKSQGCVAHVGDSRLYKRLRTDLSLITVDDTLEGVLRRPQAASDEDNLDNRLIQFVGIGADLDPHISFVTDTEDAWWLLTTDGAHSLGRQLLQAICDGAASVGELGRKLTFVADAAGVSDNASLAVLQVSALEPSYRFNRGTSLVVWTPTDKLELWFDDFVGRDDAPAPTSAESRVPATERERRKRDRAPAKAKRSKAKTDSASDAPLAENDQSSPQLNITFGKNVAPDGD